MKTIKMAVAVLAMAAAVTACGGNEKKADAKGGSNGKDTTEVSPKEGTHKASAFETNINIRYISMDSILNNYKYAVQESEKIQKKAAELQQYQNSLAAQLQKKQNEIAQKANNGGYLSQQSYEADLTEFQKLQQSSEQNYMKKAQAFEAEAAKVQADVANAIRSFVARYNETHKYDAILFEESGILFNPALNITAEIIDGLNSEATPQK